MKLYRKQIKQIATQVTCGTPWSCPKIVKSDWIDEDDFNQKKTQEYLERKFAEIFPKIKDGLRYSTEERFVEVEK